jgi:hypothetical protein
MVGTAGHRTGGENAFVHSLNAFVAFWYDFIIGDDWVVAAGVVVLLGVSGALARASMHTTAWIAMPVGVVIVLAISLRRATHAR